jgi:medium-chain acyl-[acyl-carrier-protein] hydrolase
MRLFCFPYAGGSAIIYRSWAESLPTYYEVVAVQLPGRGNHANVPPFDDMPPLVRALAPALLPHLDRPFAFFGHSMGALIGFELAQLLRREGRRGPLKLFGSGCRAPQVPRREPYTHDLPEDEFVARLSTLNGTPQEVLDHPELMQLVLPLLRADFSVAETYSFSGDPPLDCPVSAYGGLGDKDVPREDVEAWREQTTGAFNLRMFPGDHFFINTAQQLLLQALSLELTQLAGSRG